VRDVSDHNTLILDTMEARTKINRNFIFEKRWITEDDFLDRVRRSWTQNVVASNSLDRLQKKLKNVKKCLKEWEANLRGTDIKKRERYLSGAERVRGNSGKW
jgi:hypothetical protein